MGEKGVSFVSYMSRRSKFRIRKPRTWDLEPFLVSLVPPVSLSYPA